MKISQLRALLEALARQRRASGRVAEAEALVKLSATLQSSDRLTVAKVVEKLRVLSH